MRNPLLLAVQTVSLLAACTGGDLVTGVRASITSITADEAIDVGAGGDGHTTDFDAAIIDDVTFDLRSERQGGGDGRVYRIH